ncbi:unnamed protein product [Auanema sp. JU1783]|nr:unnamed protein product [Auanema sp. JU1783]
MVLIVITVVIIFFSLIWRYIGLILSTFLAFFLKVPIKVGGVRWLSLFDVRVKLAGGITVHVDTLSLHLFSQHFSKPFLLSLGDVRIETEGSTFSNRTNSGKSLNSRSHNSSLLLSRLKQVVQYCGLTVTSVHLILLDALPHCMVHITIYELSIETFRSREGWQLEVSCRLVQGKALRRKGVVGRALAEFSLPFHLSLDVTGPEISRIGLKIRDPSVNISSDVFEFLHEQFQGSHDDDDLEEEELSVVKRGFDDIPAISIDLHNSVIKYTSAYNQSRVLCLQVREIVLSQSNEGLNAQVRGVSLLDSFMKSVLKSSDLSVVVQNRMSMYALEIRSDSIHTSLSLQDALWWKEHFETTLENFNTSEKKRTGSIIRDTKSVSCSIELDSFVCELVDTDSFQSSLSVQLLTLSVTENDLEFGIESLTFSSEQNHYKPSEFDTHHWGQSVYIGIAVVQYAKSAAEPSLMICVDDCKLEWSDRLAKQIHGLLVLVGNSGESTNSKQESSHSRPIAVQAKVKRTALYLVAKDSYYVVHICDELMLESYNCFKDFVISCKNSKIGLGMKTAEPMLIKELKESHIVYPSKDDGSDLPWRTWNQKEKDRKKAEKRKIFEEKRAKGIKIVCEADMLCISLEHLSPVTRDVTISSNTPVYCVWSPLLHQLLFHIKCTVQSTFTLPRVESTVRKTPKILHLKLITTNSVELDMELSGFHRMIWRIPSLNVDWNSSILTALSTLLTININGYDIVTATNVSIKKRTQDIQMDAARKNFGNVLTSTNKVWTWAADLFSFYLPFEFNFHEVFDEFINCIKWIKIIHQNQKKPFTAESPLPCDLRIKFQEFKLEMQDDFFENTLQSSHELKEDEVYECERRRQMLADRLTQLRKKANLFPQSRMDELYASLQEKNSAIYIERWKKADHSNRSMFLSRWTGLEIRALADLSLHGRDACLKLMSDFDPMSNLPTDDIQFSTMWARFIEVDMAEWCANFKDYPIPYILAKDMHFFGTLVGAEQFDEFGRSLRENAIPLPPPFETVIVKRNMSPLKFYYDLQCESTEFSATYGPCWEPCLSMISLSWNNISAPSKDPSPPLPFWDKMRFLLHGRFSWLSERVITTMLASPDPYNTTETVEMCWNNYGLDWALGELRIRSEFRVFMRTASKYDDSRILLLPDLKLRVALDWVCSGDPHDHHSVVLCAPHKLPHYSTDHDSYRAFRSQHLDLGFSFDVAAGSTNSSHKLPNILLYANTFRCIEFLLHTLTIKNRTIKRGRIFGTTLFMKPQLSKHFRHVQVSLNLPKFFITYWMSHSSSYGFRVISDGLNLFSSLKLSMHIESDSEITRRRTYVWQPQHVSATLWGTKVHVFGEQKKPSSEGEESDDTLLIGLSRISYVRENNAVKENAVHRLTADELKASWTEEIRDACLSIADGVHRAHMLRRILSNDAIKILKLHMEEDQSIQKKVHESAESINEEGRGHRRGYSLSDTNQSMLYQLIDEAGTKLIAHCEQSTDLPADSLQGVLQCTTDDIQMINWQIDLLNSQAVLKGCERDGFILITTSKASLSQKIHKCVWRNGQLLGKKSWSAAISGMQYFAPVGMTTGQNKTLFRWLPRELIEERAPPDTGADVYMSFLGSGEAVGGIVQPDGANKDTERLQLQRIVSRCSCQIYFCYFSEELKTDALEETGVPKVEPPSSLRLEDIGVDCLTLKHNMLEASTSSDQYEMVVDIVNNLVLFLDPKKKELAEHRRKLRFECHVTDMAQMRESIVEQQSQLRDIVSVAKEEDEAKRRELYDEMEEYKNRQLEVSDQLYIYISCYKQRQVEATRAVVHCLEEDGLAAVARRFEVCFEDCIWRLTESDGQITLAETQIRNFLYTRIMRIDNSGEHSFEVGSIRVSNLLPDSIFRDTIHRDDRHITRQPAIRLLLKDLAPVGGICVKEHFEVNIAPMVVQLTSQFFEKMMGFFFPGKNIHNSENLDSIDESTPKFSFTRRIAGTLSMRSSKGAQVDRKASTASGKVSNKIIPESELNEIERMRQRADKNNFFLYIKIPEVPFIVSYKGNKDKNIVDVDRFSFLFPLCEYHERNWTWLDLSLAIKSKCKGVLLQQFMRQKLLSNRLTGKSEPVEGITEEDKKRIALGTTSSIGKKKKK